MLRRVARVSRGLLILAGCVLLALLPVRWSEIPYIEASGRGLTLLGIADGSVQFMHIRPSPSGESDVQFGLIDEGEWTFLCLDQDTTVWPSAERDVLCLNAYGHEVAAAGIPLWLLAVVCLAWPVTSFVVARRRRRGRGFEVEATGGSAVPTLDS